MDGFIAATRKITGIIVIIAVTVLTFLVILSIWDVLPSDISEKGLGSMILIGVVALLFFAAAALVQYVHHDASGAGRRWSLGWIIVVGIGMIFVLWNIFGLFFLRSF